MGIAALRDHRSDPAGPGVAPVLVVVVAAVGQQRVGVGDVVVVPAGQRHCERDALPSTMRWCLLPGRAQSTGLGPLSTFDSVMPDPTPNSWGRYSQWTPLCRTKRIPPVACLSGTRGLPSTSFGVSTGNNGAMSDHSSSDKIHGRD